MIKELELEDDNSWLDYDEEWDNKIKQLIEERKVIIQKCIDSFDRVFNKYGVDKFQEDDKLDLFIQDS